MFTDDLLKKLKTEIVYLVGHTLVPAKDLSYKTDPDTGEIIETVRPNTIKFEKALRKDLEKELDGISQFPTEKQVIIILNHGFHSPTEYRKCDLDNRAKTILDALKGPVYKDDSQVKVLLSYKELLKNSEESYYRFSVTLIDKSMENRVVKEIQSFQAKVERF